MNIQSEIYNSNNNFNDIEKNIDDLKYIIWTIQEGVTQNRGDINNLKMIILISNRCNTVANDTTQNINYLLI
jgi:peptidoglycan hydrolase CwlO-like protein